MYDLRILPVKCLVNLKSQFYLWYSVEMKLALAIVLFIVLVFVGVRVFEFIGQERSLDQSLSQVQTRLLAAQAQEADLQAETQYLSNPVNLEKEFRASFNYKKPGETMIIIVPNQTTSTATSTD